MNFFVQLLNGGRLARLSFVRCRIAIWASHLCVRKRLFDGQLTKQAQGWLASLAYVRVEGKPGQISESIGLC